ncbi:metallothionein-like protein type 3, partial [Tanacetum coccineum]
RLELQQERKRILRHPSRDSEKSTVETIVMEVPAAAEKDGKCKCGANCSCTNCTCGH